MDNKYKENILIVGFGITGRNVYKELESLKPDIYDKDSSKYPDNYVGRHIKYGFIFICVDTPYINAQNPCDISSIFNVINTWKDYLVPDGIMVLKSTVLPYQLNTIQYVVPQERFVYSPEFYGNTQHCNNFEFNYTILGGNKLACYETQQLLQKVHDARHQFKITNARTAALAKYMENCYLATKVSFCNQFADICKLESINYEDVRELFILDPRVNPSHTFVYQDKPYWDTHCLNKDVRAIAETYNAELINDIIKFNDKQKRKIFQK